MSEEVRDDLEYNEVVPNYAEPPGIRTGADDFPNREPRFGMGQWLIIGCSVLAFATLAMCIPKANAASPWEITATFPGRDYDRVTRAQFTLGAPYESRETCLNAITRVRIHVPGVRLMCTPVVQLVER